MAENTHKSEVETRNFTNISTMGPDVHRDDGNRRNDNFTTFLGFLLLPAIYITLIFTYSRASYLALFGGMALITFQCRSLKLFLISLIVVGLTFVFLPRPAGEGGNLSRTSTINFRLQNWSQAWQVVQDHPFMGVGFNRYRYIQRDYGFVENNNWEESHSGAGVDNSWLFVLTTSGIVGLVSYLWLWWQLFREALTKFRSYVFLAILIALVIHSQFHNTLFYPAVMGWMWILTGLDLEKEEARSL